MFLMLRTPIFDRFLVHRRRGLSSTVLNVDKVPRLPLRFIRDSWEGNFDSGTHQRNDISYNHDNGKPEHDYQSDKKYKVKKSTLEGKDLVITWGDGISSKYTLDSLNKVHANWKKPQVSRELWTGLTESHARTSEEHSISFGDLIRNEKGMSRAVRALYKYGILLVSETPTDDNGAGIAALASALSGSPKKDLASTSLLANYKQGGTNILLPNGTDGPLRTLYGSVWFTTSAVQAEGTSVADSAYGVDGLPLHTDMTYMLSPPGLQIFTMIQPSEQGGESVYADGFAAAETLRNEDADAFCTLSTTVRKYHCIDKATGWHLEAAGPVIELRNGAVIRIRHNDLDRLPDLPPYSETDDGHEIYEKLAHAHTKWDEILGRESTRLLMKLEKGDTVVVANQVGFVCCHAESPVSRMIYLTLMFFL
jgi:hypothetical protein